MIMFPPDHHHRRHHQQQQNNQHQFYSSERCCTTTTTNNSIAVPAGGNNSGTGLMNRLEGYDHHYRYSSEDNNNNTAVCLGSDPLLLLLHAPYNISSPSSIIMAEDEESSRANTTASTTTNREIDNISKDEEGWLQLGLGAAQSLTGRVDPVATSMAHHRSAALELDLFSGARSYRHMAAEFRAPPPLPPGRNLSTSDFGTASFLFQPHQEQLNWASSFRPMIPSSLTAHPPPSSSSSSLMPTGPYYYPRSPFHQQLGISVGAGTGGVEVGAGPSSSSSFRRVVDAPWRPHSGIWCMLQASQNQGKDPFLPQIPKSYLRIKDGKMPVRLLVKYLVKKLGLQSESEVEVRCRGEKLEPLMTMQHVRDHVWRQRDTVTLLPDSPTTDHVMVLHYGRSAA